MKEIGKKLSAGMLFNKIVLRQIYRKNQHLGGKEERTLRKTPPGRVKLYAVCVPLGMFYVRPRKSAWNEAVLEWKLTLFERTCNKNKNTYRKKQAVK